MNTWKVLALVCAGLVALATFAARILVHVAIPWKQPPIASIRAVHYWGGASPANFWDSTDPSVWNRDFKQIRADGFNTIVVVVPWTAFQPKLDPQPQYNERDFAMLRQLLRVADHQRLGVVLRLGYLWSFDPDTQKPRAERMAALFADDKVYNDWLDFVAETCRRVCDAPNLRFAFLSWEDIYPIDLAPATIRKPLVDYLATHYPLNAIASTYNRSFSDWSEVPVADRKAPGYRYVFEYWDDALIERFFKPAQKRFPLLSLEVRIDRDPVWSSDGKVDWYGHEHTYALPGAPAVTSYYSIGWGMKNDGDLVTAPKALGKLDEALSYLRANAVPGQPIFIDQVLFFDATPGWERNTKLFAEELNPFIIGAGGRFQAHQAGYALWEFRDEGIGLTYNSSFQLGWVGWSAIGNPRLVRRPNEAVYLALDRASGVAQTIDDALHGSPPGAVMQACARGKGSSGRDADVAVSIDQKVAGTLHFPGAADDFRLECVSVHAKKQSFSFALSAVDNPVVINDVMLFSHMQQSRLYDLNGEPGPQLSAIRQLNLQLEADRTDRR